MITLLFIFSFIYLLFCLFGIFCLGGRIPILSAPILFLQPLFIGLVAIYLGANAKLVYSLIILSASAHCFIIESTRRGYGNYGLPFPKTWRHFNNINTPLSVIASWSLYIICAMAVYHKFFG